MRNWRKYRSDKAQRKRSERAAHAARVRCERYHADLPVRQTRTVVITIRDSARPMSVIRATQHERMDGRWTRFYVEGFSGRPVSASGLGAMIGRITA